MDTPPSHYSHAMSSGDPHYSQQQSQQQQQSQPQPPWSQPPHLLPPSHNPSSFPSPSSPSTSLQDQHYPPYYPHQSQQMADPSLQDRPSTALSLNLSSLSVASPTNLSPIHPSPHPNSHISPITPISPSNAALHHQNSLSPHHPHSHHHPQIPQPFQFTPPDTQSVRYDDASSYDYNGSRRLTSSRSSSSSEKSVPRKRSFTTGTPLPTSVEESATTPVSGNYDHSNGAMDTSPYDDVDINYNGLDPENSPIDGSVSGGEQDDQLKPLEGSMSAPVSVPMAPAVSILGKPLGTNNFVTKLYQMINDSKSAQFISWTELGTSFVVSNVGEFSRTILGSHFKHNNFSSFVRQLNMYGFHKINRTPRAQRTSADVQTWEFSHHKFLRGRPDLLEEIKRKALEPDPSLKHRVELPGEVAAQLTQMRDENRRLIHAVNAERSKVDRLTGVTKALYDVILKVYPGSLPVPFPPDLLESSESPNILVTSPTNPMAPTHFPSLSSLSNPSLHSLHSLSPSSSPTAAEFPSHTHTPHTLSRQQSFQHMPYDTGAASMHHPHAHQHHAAAAAAAMGHGVSTARYETALSTPLPPSPGPGMDAFGDDIGRGSVKRQRTGNSMGNGDDSMTGVVPGGIGVSKKGSRARSDSAPLGYGLSSGWTQTRPRSGSGLGQRLGRREELPIPNIGSLSRGHVLPMLSIPKQSPT